jgi:signal transduction histidine kinase
LAAPEIRTAQSGSTPQGAELPAVPSRQVAGMLRNVALVAVYVTTALQIARALADVDGRAPWYLYLVLGGVYLVVLTLMIWRPVRRALPVHVVLAVLCGIVLVMYWLEPELDWLTGLFVPLAFLAALLLRGRAIWIWLAILAVLILGSLMGYFGPLRGLSLGLTSVALAVVLASYAVVAREIEASRDESQRTAAEIEAVNARLQEYAAQADELATFRQRDLVARELNESVARAVAGILADTRTARAAFAAEPVAGDGGGDARSAEAEAARLASLQQRTQQTLKQMRDLIGELRPKAADPADPAGARATH